jgi:hypothetical protein
VREEYCRKSAAKEEKRTAAAMQSAAGKKIYGSRGILLLTEMYKVTY